LTVQSFYTVCLNDEHISATFLRYNQFTKAETPFAFASPSPLPLRAKAHLFLFFLMIPFQPGAKGVENAVHQAMCGVFRYAKRRALRSAKNAP